MSIYLSGNMNQLSVLLACVTYLVLCCSAIKGSSPVFQPSQSSPSQSHIINSTATTEQLHLHQLYSEWSGWSSCSSTCGLGIITRTRSCLRSAYNSKGVYVPLCHAEYSEHRICNLQHCPADAPHPRSSQCAHHNNRTVAGKIVQEWIPADGGPNPCELRCKDASGDLEYGFGKVSSGTPCPQGVCLDGRCLKVGCDDRLGSEVVLDMCGVCGGRNAGCVHYKDVYMGQPPADAERRNGYHEVVVLPVGARNLIIRQLVGKNYLALQDRTRGIIFNGEQHLTQYGGHYNIAGTTVQFEKSDNKTEILTAKGPVTQELFILVLLRTFNQGIYYEYWLAKQSHNPARNKYSLRYGNPTTTTTTTTTISKPKQDISPTRVHYHPTKPAFAYGYGEKPYRSEDAPVFRHVSHSTTSTPSSKPPFSPQRYVTPQYIPGQRNGNIGTYKKDSNPLYNPRTYKPSAGYYQTFRNLSSDNFKKSQDLDRELPVLTQPDSSDSGRNRYDNIIPNTVLDDKKREPAFKKSQKPPRSTIDISKRGGSGEPKFVSNGRLKYSFEGKDADEVYVNTSGRYTPSPVAIALLPDSSGEGGKSNKEKKSGGKGRRKNPRFSRGGTCAPCERNRDQTKHFCESDFVIRALVVGYEFLQGETRYELEIKQTFKNTLSLLPKEYVWSPDTSCRCPRLRPGKEYVVMGRIDNNYRKRESRLLVDKTCFVRTFNLKYARRLQKLRKDHTKKCTKTS